MSHNLRAPKDKRKVTHYPSEFKESLTKLAVESKESVAQIAKNLGVHGATLQGWIERNEAWDTFMATGDVENETIRGLIDPVNIVV